MLRFDKAIYLSLLLRFILSGTFFTQYKEYKIFLISISKVSDVLIVFTCARAIGNVSSIVYGLIF